LENKIPRRFPIKLTERVIAIKGAGEMASAVAWRLYVANLRSIFMMETAMPLAVRREVSFCEAVHRGSKTVEGVEAVKAGTAEDIPRMWRLGKVAVIVDPEWRTLNQIKPDVVVDAILAKQNLGTRKDDAPLVIGLGPGFVAGGDVHLVIETNRGHHLGRLIFSGSAEPDTGIPAPVGGVAAARVLRAPAAGEFQSSRNIGEAVRQGEVIGRVGETEVTAGIDGVLRGLMRTPTRVPKGIKLGDIDPRGEAGFCCTISDKARAVAGSVLEAILRTFNT
jgi:xanthine dehydrogenase accessory factor